MALNPNALITLALLKQFIGIAGDDTSKDFLLELYINAISDAIEKRTGRKFKADDYTETYIGTDQVSLLLRQSPIISVASVDFVDELGNLIASDYFDWTIDHTIEGLYKPGGWARIGGSSFLSEFVNFPLRYVKVVYRAGYETIPSDLQLACAEICANLYDIKQNGSGLLSSYSISDISMSFDNRTKSLYSEGQKTLIDSYRRRRV